MSMQSSLYTLLNGIFSGRFYPRAAPHGVATPYATWRRIIAIEQNTLDTNGGTGNETNTRMQINVWATTALEAGAKADAIKAALKGWGITNVLLEEQDTEEPDTLLYGVILDISIWHL